MMAKDDAVSKEQVFLSVASEAAGYYKLIVTVASSFLGGSLLFLERIAPRPSQFSLVVLAAGWASLIASIGLVAWIRAKNLESGALVLAGDYDRAKTIDSTKMFLSNWATVLLCLGMLLIMLCGLLNVWSEQSGTSGVNLHE